MGRRLQGKVGLEERLKAGLEEIEVAMIQIIDNHDNAHENNELLITMIAITNWLPGSVSTYGYSRQSVLYFLPLIFSSLQILF